MSPADAWESFLADLTARRVSSSTIGKYKLLQRQLEAYGQSRGLACVVDFDLETLSRFRATYAKLQARQAAINVAILDAERP